jgi:hypothetical protein
MNAVKLKEEKASEYPMEQSNGEVVKEFFEVVEVEVC